MATSIGAFLMLGTTAGSSTTYTQLVKIKDFPQLGAAPEALESTTCADPRKTYEEGLEDIGALSFKANYSLADYNTLVALKGEKKKFQIWLGGTVSDDGLSITPTGSNGKYELEGYLSVYVESFSVNSIIEMTLQILPTAGPVIAS